MASLESPNPIWRDEKAVPLLEDGDDERRRGRRAKIRNPFNVVGSVILVLLTLASLRMIHRRISFTPLDEKPSACHHGEEDKLILDFKDIIPSEKLRWHRCYQDLRCARLTVPMDYNRPLNASKDNPKVSIALLMVPGRNHTISGKYSKSPLLLNPGGPGGSGVGMALYAGSPLQSIVGDDQDIIGFDPRGVGQTTPVADCFAFPSDGKSRDLTGEEISRGFFHKFLWALSGLENELVNSTADSLRKIDLRDRASEKLCKAKDDVYGDDSILRHVSTPSVARDMLSIIDAWDEWMDESNGDDSSASIEKVSAPESDEEVRSLDTKGKLVFWGFSYGSLLGATFAAMFPDRVGRVVLDGVVDADYYVSPMWTESLRDTDNIMNSFFYFCHKAGKNCALYRPGDSEADVRVRFDEATETLKKNPINGVNWQTMTPTVFTYSALKSFIFQFLYSPTFTFPILAEIFNLIHRGDEKTLLQIFPTGNGINQDFFCSDLEIGYEGQDATFAIMCSDKRYPLNETVSTLQARFEKMAQYSSFADRWMTLMIGCNSWSIPATDPPMRWDDHPAHKPDPIKTSYPLLFLSNTYDPVTPLQAGVKMARKFVDAGFIEQKGMGHCSLSAASYCMLLKVRAYFQNGTLPPVPQWGPDGHKIDGGKWDRCESEDWPWKEPTSAWRLPEVVGASETLSAEEQDRQRVERAWSWIRDVSVTHLDFWTEVRKGSVDGGREVDWWKLGELREERGWWSAEGEQVKVA